MPVKISELPLASALTATDAVPLVQGGVTKQGLLSQIGTFVRALFTTTPATVAEGGTNAATAAGARTSLGVAASGLATASGLTMNTARLLGRTTAAVGAVEEVAINYGMTLAGSALTLSMSHALNVLSGDVTLNNTGTYFDGPSVAQGATGTWIAIGWVTLVDTAGAAAFSVKLYDGTTVAASAQTNTVGANSPTTVTLVGVFAAPPGNIRMAVIDVTSTSGKILFNQSGNSKDSGVVVLRFI